MKFSPLLLLFKPNRLSAGVRDIWLEGDVREDDLSLACMTQQTKTLRTAHTTALDRH